MTPLNNLPGLALCEVSWRGSSAGGFRRAGLARREAGWILSRWARITQAGLGARRPRATPSPPAPRPGSHHLGPGRTGRGRRPGRTGRGRRGPGGVGLGHRRARPGRCRRGRLHGRARWASPIPVRAVRLLRLFCSASLLGPSLYGEEGRSGGEGGVVNGLTSSLRFPRVPLRAGSSLRPRRPPHRGRGPVTDPGRGRRKWRSGRIVPPRTRRLFCGNRGIMRKLSGASGALARTILPERQSRDPMGSKSPPRGRGPIRPGPWTRRPGPSRSVPEGPP